MQIASILSDLTSLRVCDHSAAFALVTVHKDPGKGQENDEQTDEDMQRVKDLVDLHYNVKEKHVQGDDGDLKQARNDVDAVLWSLEEKTSGGRRNA